MKTVAAIFFMLLAAFAATTVTEQQLREAQSDSAAWLTYGKNYAGWRYSELSEINTSSVSRLAPRWIYQTGQDGSHETTPLVFGGMMFVTGPSNHADALDLLTGKQIWHYHKTPPSPLSLCCGQPNRGFAALGSRLYKVNIDATLVALDALSGTVLWEKPIDDYRKGFTATAAPIILKDKVVVGIAGAEFGTRSFIDAYDSSTGERVWRFYTVAAKGEPGGDTWDGDSWQRGGGSTWITGTYDPELNLIYWGTGNPGPGMDGSVRAGDNLYTCSLVAIDAERSSTITTRPTCSALACGPTSANSAASSAASSSASEMRWRSFERDRRDAGRSSRITRSRIALATSWRSRCSLCRYAAMIGSDSAASATAQGCARLIARLPARPR